MKVLPAQELGMGNTIQVVAYKAGSVFAGGLLLWFQQVLGWSGMFIIFGSIYLVGLILLNYFKLVEKSSAHLEEPEAEKSQTYQEKTSWYSIFNQILSVPGTKFMIFYVSFYKLCERAEQTFSLFMVDKGVPKVQMAMWSTIMRTLSLLGSSYGGFIVSKRKSEQFNILRRYSLLRAVPIIVQFAILSTWGSDTVPVENFSKLNSDSMLMYLGFLCTSFTLFTAGVITTATFTIMMRSSQRAPKQLQGTHFTTLATFEVLGKLAYASVAGAMIDAFGIQVIFASFIFLALACIPLLQRMPVLLWN